MTEVFTAFGRLELEWCERKILLPGWWLKAGAGAKGAPLFARKQNEQVYCKRSEAA